METGSQAPFQLIFVASAAASLLVVVFATAARQSGVNRVIFNLSEVKNLLDQCSEILTQLHWF
jgi:hypothetical protein